MKLIVDDRIVAIDPLSDKRWDDFIQKHPNGSVYHHSAWINLVTSTFPYSPHCYALIEKETGRIRGGVPFLVWSGLFRKRCPLSMPYASYCDPLVPNERLVEILDDVLENCPGPSHAELKLRSGSLQIPDALEKESLFLHHTIDLSSDIDTVFAKFHNSCVRRKISKAQKSNLEFRFSECEEDIKGIYDLLLRMRKQKGLPPHPYQFFLNMWKMLGPLNMFFAPYVTYQNKMVSAAIVLKFKDKVYYEYGASEPDYQKLGVTQFLLWEIIKFSHHEGAQSLDLGRSHIENRSLIEFKDRWGAGRQTLTYCYYPKRRNSKKMAKWMEWFGKEMVKRLPEPLLRLEGEFIYRFLR